MAYEAYRMATYAVNTALRPLGVRVERLDRHDPGDVANFIPFDATVKAAEQSGLSVGDYVDAVMNGTPGSSQRTVDQMRTAGVFDKPLKSISEIGPGTGRYLEKIVRDFQYDSYEIYETAGKWANYIVSQYDVILRQTDGYSMSETPDSSVDLAHAHKVFSTVPFMVSICYLKEFARTVRTGGWVVFDAMTDACLVDGWAHWSSSGIRNASFPAVLPRSLILDFFIRNGFELRSSALVPLPPGSTELLMFQRVNDPGTVVA